MVEARIVFTKPRVGIFVSDENKAIRGERYDISTTDEEWIWKVGEFIVFCFEFPKSKRRKYPH